ncbi:hypothetical protein [Streptomyces europaeiscabiei]|uniref:hypothetical protein n=1 Tax=Streptomyces europaeiscabiei TaxID=146819 RepID=UPI0029A4C01A|nr:hypothetical protein [Streptomyces europaeiscabiei]MDX3841040.1 hypothetical protein [Streptomyces europaeiscabiei]
MNATELPKIPGPGTLPAFLDDSPAGPLVDEYRRMRAEYDLAARAYRKHHGTQAAADEDDRQARAVALRAGRKDPGDKHQDALQKDIDASRRATETAATAVTQVWAELRRRLTHDDMTTWAEEQARTDQDTAERLHAALTEATTAFAEIAAGAARTAWLTQALAHTRGDQKNGHPTRWPHGTRTDLVRIEVGSYTMTPQDILTLLANAARTATQ